MTDLTAKKPLHFVQLDALRFLAAFMIVILHGWEAWIGWFKIPKHLAAAGGEDYNWFGQHLNVFVRNFGFGVDIFFLISGFLITFLLLKEKNDSGRINIKAFYVRRILRVWPLYFFVIAVSPLLVIWLQHSNPGFKQPEFAPVIFFYNNFRTIQLQDWQFPFAHFWSICVEEHFYLVWPFLVALFPMKRLPYIFGAVIALSIGFRAFVWEQQWSWFHLYLNTLSRIDALALGGLVAWIHYHRPYKLKLPLVVRLLILGFLVWRMSVDDMNAAEGLLSATMKKFVYLLPAGLLMMHFVFGEKTLLKFGPKHPVNYLGRCCFGIYLWGNILLQLILYKIIGKMAAHETFGATFASWNGWIYWPIVIGISLLVPVISYELIEKPFLKLKTRFAVVRTRV